MNRMTVALVDDHPMLLEGLRRLFSDTFGYDIVGEGASAEDAVAIARVSRPDVLLLDLSMPGDPFGAIKDIASVSPTTKVVAFTAMASVDCAIRVLEAGASGYLLKGSSAQDIAEAMRCIGEGENYISPAFATKVISALSAQSRRKQEMEASRLNVREVQIAELLQQGLTNREIGQRLEISEKTVRHYMTLLMRKLKVRNRVEAVIAVRERAGAAGTTRIGTSDTAKRAV